MLNCEFRRRKHKWTQYQLADLVRIGQPYICLLEQGRWAPTPDQLIRLSNALDLAPEDIFKPVVAECDAPPEPPVIEVEAPPPSRDLD